VSDRIELRGLRLLAICGALPEEKYRPQPLEIDLVAEVDLTEPGRTDALADTVDYGALARAAATVAEEGRFTLLEHLAQRIADQVCSDSRVESVTVSVHKLRPPTPVHLASAGVTITRRAADRRPPGARAGGTGVPTDVPATVAHGVADIAAGEAGPTRRQAFLGLGSNLGDREAHLREALDALPGVKGVSQVYETEPLGGPPGQGPYLNLVVELDTDLSPRSLLEVAKRLEEAAGRQPSERHAPRPLDVDVLLVGDLAVDEPDLVVPHPRMHERRFVLGPLADLAPELVPEGWETNATGAIRRLGTL